SVGGEPLEARRGRQPRRVGESRKAAVRRDGERTDRSRTRLKGVEKFPITGHTHVERRGVGRSRDAGATRRVERGERSVGGDGVPADGSAAGVRDERKAAVVTEDEAAPSGASPDASDTIAWARLVTAKPNGAAPVEGCRSTRASAPPASVRSTLIALAERSVTRIKSPSRLAPIVDGPSDASPSDTRVTGAPRGTPASSSVSTATELSELSTNMR